MNFKPGKAVTRQSNYQIKLVLKTFIEQFSFRVFFIIFIVSIEFKFQNPTQLSYKMRELFCCRLKYAMMGFKNLTFHEENENVFF